MTDQTPALMPCPRCDKMERPVGGDRPGWYICNACLIEWRPKHSPLPEATRAPALPDDVAGLAAWCADAAEHFEGLGAWGDLANAERALEAAAALRSQAAHIAALEAERDRLREFYDAEAAVSRLGLFYATDRMLARLRKARAALAEPASDAGEGA